MLEMFLGSNSKIFNRKVKSTVRVSIWSTVIRKCLSLSLMFNITNQNKLMSGSDNLEKHPLSNLMGHERCQLIFILALQDE